VCSTRVAFSPPYLVVLIYYLRNKTSTVLFICVHIMQLYGNIPLSLAKHPLKNNDYKQVKKSISIALL